MSNEEYLKEQERLNKPFYDVKVNTVIEIKSKRYFVYEKGTEEVDYGHHDIGNDSYVLIAPMTKNKANVKKAKRYSLNYSDEYKLPKFKLIGKAKAELVVKLIK